MPRVRSPRLALTMRTRSRPLPGGRAWGPREGPRCAGSSPVLCTCRTRTRTRRVFVERGFRCSCCKALPRCLHWYLLCRNNALPGSTLLLPWGVARTKNSRDLSFQDSQNFLLSWKHFPHVSFRSLNVCVGGQVCACLKKNPVFAFLRDPFNAVHWPMLFSQLRLSVKDWMTFVKHDKIQAHQFDAFHRRVLPSTCVLVLLRGFRFAVDSRSLNSSLTDFIPWLNF